MRSWSGWYEQNGGRHPINFVEVWFDEAEKKYKCEGDDDAGNFTMTAVINGNAFRAEKEYSSWTIVYEGRLVGGEIDGNGRSVNSKVNGQWHLSTNRNWCGAFEIST